MKKKPHLKGSTKELTKRRDDMQVEFRALKKEQGETKHVKFLRKRIKQMSREIERRKNPKKGSTLRPIGTPVGHDTIYRDTPAAHQFPVQGGKFSSK